MRASCRAFAHALPAPTRTPRSAMLRSRALAAWAWALFGFRSAAFPAREQIKLCELAARAGCVGSMASLRERGCEWDSYTCSAAAEGGHLEVLQWDRYTCYAAALGGDLKVLKWAHEHGCEWDRQQHVLRCS